MTFVYSQSIETLINLDHARSIVAAPPLEDGQVHGCVVEMETGERFDVVNLTVGHLFAAIDRGETTVRAYMQRKEAPR